MSTPIRGTTVTCLLHYVQGLPVTPDRARIVALKPIETYCQSAARTIRRWGDGTMPKGERLIRLRFFLASQGYQVAELEKLNPVLRTFGQLIAGGKLDMKQMIQRLSYRDDQAILEMLYGVRQPLPDRLTIIEHIIAEHAQPTTEQVRSTVSPPIPAIVSKTVERTTTERRLLSQLGRQQLMAAAVRQIQELLPNLELLTGREFTEAERQRVREQAGRQTVFQTAIGLYKLSGERARTIIEQDERTGGRHD